MKNIIERAKEKWNNQADKYNSWEALGLDEMLDLIIEEEKLAGTGAKCNCLEAICRFRSATEPDLCLDPTDLCENKKKS